MSINGTFTVNLLYMLCPECGREVEELVDGACAACAAQRLTLVMMPSELRLVVCAHCGRLQDGNRWVSAPREPAAVFHERALATVHVDPAAQDVEVRVNVAMNDERHATARVAVEARFHGHPVSAAVDMRSSIRNGVCVECSRRQGGYFEATIQVRGHPDRPIEDVEQTQSQMVDWVETMASEGREGAYFSNMQRVKGGLDLFVGRQDVARAVARRLADAWGAIVQETAKLVGRTDDGRDQYRITILVRRPEYATGDVVAISNAPSLLLGADRKTVDLLDLGTWSRRRVEPERVGGLRLVARADRIREAVVVSQRGAFAQIMDPVSYQTVDVNVPDGQRLSEAARVVRFDERWWLIPPQAKQ